MDIYSAFATNEKAEVEGRDCPLDVNTSITVARSGNKEYLKLLRAVLKKNKLNLAAEDDASNALAEKLVIGVEAQAILLGWSGIKFKGAELPYSVENAKTLLGVKDFRAKVLELAGEFEGFRVKEDEAQGNA